MSKDSIDRAADAIKGTVEDARDRAHETKHRSAAEIERERRDIAGDELTPGEKAGSVANEAKHRAQAEVDAMKRELRDNKT